MHMQRIRCGVLLQMSHVAWSVCWWHGSARQTKRLNRSRCRLKADGTGTFRFCALLLPGANVLHGKTFVHKTVSSPADSGGPKESRIRWGRYSPTGRAILGVVRPTEKHWESNEQFRRLHTESAMMWWVTKKMKNGCCFTLGERDNPFLI